MSELFYTILNMSISASILVLVVLLLRLVFRKAPKWVNVLLWALVAIRLICPFAIESPFSLMPNMDYLAVKEAVSYVDMGFDSVPDDIPEYVIGGNQAGDDVPVHTYPTDPVIEIPQKMSLELILSFIWLSGIAVMLIYMIVSCICVYRRVRNSTQFRDNIYTSDAVTSPFVFGIFRPRIYLSESMDAVNISYVIAHEEAHLRRHDHWWKPIGFILLAVHWFNPIIWLAYVLLCRDIEMACDERVVRDMGDRERADYSEALLDCSVNSRSGAKHRKMITACPLAFGENNVKVRIRTVLNYKKPAFWIVILAVIACAVAAVCFLTNPLGDMFSGDKTLFIYYDDPAEILHYPYQLENDTVVNVKFKSTQSPKTVSLEIFCRKSSIFDEWQKSDMATLKLGETASFTVPEGHMFMIKAVRDSGTNGNVTFEITYGENKVHDSVLIEKEDTIGMIPDDKKRLTLADVITLSVKGSDLKWEDFAGYSHIVTGSGLYIHVYEIDETFELWIGGGSPIGTPSYIYLTLSEDIDTRIDIRDNGVEEFVHLHQKIHLEPTAFTNEDKVNFAYTLLTDSLELTDPKTQIYSKMLNAIDYYNSAHIEFYPYMLSDNLKVVCELDLDSGKAYQASYINNELTQEYFSDGETVCELNHKRKYYDTDYCEAFTRKDSEAIPISKRITISSDGLPSYNYRRNVTNCTLSSYTLFPQELAFSYLSNFSRWSIVEESTFLGRKCVVIEGTNSPYIADKHNASTFRLTVDKDTGIVLMLTGEKGGEKIKMIEVTSLELGISSVYQEMPTDTDLSGYNIK